MWFKKRNPNNEYLRFIKLVEDEYKKIDVSFEYRNYPISNENPKETPDHYSIFAYWVINKLKNEKNANILDVGNTKVANMILSIKNNVSALVLDKPTDDISHVNWIIKDVSEKLSFPTDHFDYFISPSTLHLIGQGRYKDKKNPFALVDFLKELNRVMKQGSKMYLLLPLGRDQLLYGFHFIYSFETINKIYFDWEIIDYMVDNEIKFGFKDKPLSNNRFDKNTDVSNFKLEQYKIIYLELRKK